jgi:hypothetical protein
VTEHQHEAWQLDEEGRYCRACGDWLPASNGSGKRHWFLHRDAALFADRYHTNSRGDLIRYATYESASRAADRLNREDSPVSPSPS